MAPPVPRHPYRIIFASMTKLFRGLYRTTAGVYVADDAMAFNVPEAEYRAFGYEPDYDCLPWKENYIAAKAGKAAHAEQTKD
jgi:hypothetical protein